jgi:acyl-CoA oxidase
MTTSVWEAAWIAQVGELRDAANYEVSAARLRALIKTKLLLYTDIENEPAKFFTAHRHLVEPKKRGPGFCVRFTVQYNLFAGTVIGLGDEAQVRSLSAMQEQGLLGCFALTERLAGVNSGLVVQTTATLGPDGRFHIRSPTPGSWKNWISQGLTADKAVVVADLVVKGKSHGPHAFLVDMRVDGRLVEGISLQDMGRKTIGNDLDNAAIGFDIHVPQSALLARFARIEKGTYVQTTGEKMRIEVIGQRLLTGRVAVSQWALEFCKKCAFATGWGGLTPNTYGLPRLYAATYEYASTKKCWWVLRAGWCGRRGRRGRREEADARNAGRPTASPTWRPSLTSRHAFPASHAHTTNPPLPPPDPAGSVPRG